MNRIRLKSIIISIFMILVCVQIRAEAPYLGNNLKEIQESL